MERPDQPQQTPLQVYHSFKPSRIARQCLATAYEHLVPLPRRPVASPSVPSDTQQPPQVQKEGGS